MKVKIVLIMAMIGCMIGCGYNDTSITESTQSSISKEELNSEEFNPDDFVMPTKSPEANPPEQGIYATCELYDFELYTTNMMQTFTFHIISKEPLPESTTLEVDTEIPYKVSILEQDVSQLKPSSIVYRTYRDFDWNLETQRKLELDAIQEKLEKAESEGASKEEIEQIENEKSAIYKKYNELIPDYMEEYQFYLEKLSEEGQKFYCYLAAINFNMSELKENEIICEVKLKADDLNVTFPIKNLELIQCERKMSNPDKSVEFTRTAISGYYTSKWGNGIEIIDNQTIGLKVKDNVTLKRFYAYEDENDSNPNQSKVGQVKICIHTDGGAQEFIWEDDVFVRAGETVDIGIEWIDSNMEEACYATNKIFVIEYEMDGIRYRETLEFNFLREIDPWEVYVWKFEGIEVDKYYKEYYNICHKDNEL